MAAVGVYEMEEGVGWVPNGAGYKPPYSWPGDSTAPKGPRDSAERVDVRLVNAVEGTKVLVTRGSAEFIVVRAASTSAAVYSD